MTAALDLRDLHFGYGRATTVRGVSLTLQPGDCYGFLGHNGAGKTTVLRLATGLLTPRRGSVHVGGIDLRHDPRAARAQLGALIERPGFRLHATARQNLRTLARLQGLPRPLARAECDRVLDATGLAAAADARVGTFSLGMRQRLGIAQALLGRPRVLLLDEPTNGLDPEGIAELRELLLQLTRRDGVAVLVSSHQLAELDGLCNRIGVLRDGAMVVEGAIDDLRRQIGARHVVRGTPLPALAATLRTLALPCEPGADGDGLRVDLGDRAPGPVVRALAAAGELASFALEPVTLEQLYLRAAQLRTLPTTSIAVDVPPTAAPCTVDPTRKPMGSQQHPLWRTVRHELQTMLQQRSAALLLVLPAAVGVFAVFSYHRSVQAALAAVARGERFSADAGSGHLATAQALQSATPIAAVALLWLASQSIAADLGADTLRNTLLRAVTRLDVLLGKFVALGAAALAIWTTTVLATTTAARTWLGFGDLEEVSRHGDRQLLAAAADLGAPLRTAVASCVLPLLALTAIGLLLSALSKRPARALLLTVAAVLVPELARDRLREHAGWLLTSHLPLGLRDDSAFGWVAALARGAADALWPWRDLATAAPAAWLGGALLLAIVAMRRLRVG